MRPLQQIERWVRRRIGARLAPLPTIVGTHALSSMRSILLLRIDRLGDATISTPIIATIAERFPDATIDILLSQKNAALAPAIPHIRRHLLWTKNPFHLVATFLSLRTRRYDLCINLHVKPSGNAMLAARVAGATSYVDARLVDRTDDAADHIVEQTSRIVAFLGVKRIERRDEMDYPLRLLGDEVKSDRTGVEDVARILINVSVFDPTRRWPVEKIERLSMTLRDAGMPHAFIGSPGDLARLRILSERTGAGYIEPSDDILRLLTSLRRALLVVTPDTFIVHAAAALGLPVVGLYGSEEAVREWRPWGVRHEAILNVDGVAAIEVDDVVDAIRRLSGVVVQPHRNQGSRFVEGRAA